MKTLEDFLRPTQKQLFKLLAKKFKGKAILSKGNFILVRGTAPVMLVAHLDTVHIAPVKQICASKDGNILMSPQGIGGDDRCGVFALIKIYHSAQVKPWLLFTCDEEVGGLGAQQFCLAHSQRRLPSELDALKFLVERLTAKAKMTPFTMTATIPTSRSTLPARVSRPLSARSPTFRLSRRNWVLRLSTCQAVITTPTPSTNSSTLQNSTTRFAKSGKSLGRLLTCRVSSTLRRLLCFRNR